MTPRCYSHIDELGRSHCCFRHQAPAGQQSSTGSEAIDLRSGLDKIRLGGDNPMHMARVKGICASTASAVAAAAAWQARIRVARRTVLLGPVHDDATTA
jgi:hypothetical protein